MTVLMNLIPMRGLIRRLGGRLKSLARDFSAAVPSPQPERVSTHSCAFRPEHYESMIRMKMFF